MIAPGGDLDSRGLIGEILSDGLRRDQKGELRREERRQAAVSIDPASASVLRMVG
jgi:hypothetical protein